MIELRSLRHIVALAAACNYRRAGEAVGLSQSALTRSIQSVEIRCGMRLFDRDRGSVRVTRDGAAFVNRAKALLANADELMAFVQRASNSEEGGIPFGIEPMPARALLTPVLSSSIAEAPNMRNKVLIRSIGALWGLLKDGEIDFFISALSPLPATLNIRTSILGAFPLSFLVRAGHPLIGARNAPGPFPVFLAGEANSFGSLPSQLEGLIGGPRHIIEDYEILAKVLIASDAILVSSSLAVQDEIKQGLIVELPFDDEQFSPHMPIAMHSLARRPLSPQAVKLEASFERQLHIAINEWPKNV